MKRIGRPKSIIYPKLPYNHSHRDFCETLFRKGVIEITGLGRFEVRKMKKSRMKYNNFAKKIMRVGGGLKIYFKPDRNLMYRIKNGDKYIGEFAGVSVYKTKK